MFFFNFLICSLVFDWRTVRAVVINNQLLSHIIQSKFKYLG